MVRARKPERYLVAENFTKRGARIGRGKRIGTLTVLAALFVIIDPSPMSRALREPLSVQI